MATLTVTSYVSFKVAYYYYTKGFTFKNNEDMSQCGGLSIW